MTDVALSNLWFEYVRKAAKPSSSWSTLYDLFKTVWAKDTASPACQDGWERRHPSTGQCAVTALVIQDMCGGEIVRMDLGPLGSHYLNRMPNGEGYTDLDVTWFQFPHETQRTVAAPADRSAMLESARAATFRTPDRYMLLKSRVERAMREAIAASGK